MLLEEIAACKSLTDIAEAASMVIAGLGFLWAVVTYFSQQAQLKKTRRIEATQPFLERQLTLYTEATRLAASIAAAEDDTDTSKEEARFWQLYLGELALVESKEVETAMINYGTRLRGLNSQNLEQLSVRLAHACRQSLAKSWGVPEWNSDYIESATP